jgi:hypothetical protein
MAAVVVDVVTVVDVDVAAVTVDQTDCIPCNVEEEGVVPCLVCVMIHEKGACGTGHEEVRHYWERHPNPKASHRKCHIQVPMPWHSTNLNDSRILGC